MRPRVLVLAAALTLAACGGGSSAQEDARPADTRKPQASDTPAPRAAKPAPDPSAIPGAHRASAASVHTIRAWTDTLRRGDVKKAATYFDLPVIVSNSGGPIKLNTRFEVRFFNLSLPCGARFVSAIAGKRYTIATFRLVERRDSPSGCDGIGHLAATAFAFRHGKISEWRRVTVPPATPEA